MSEEARRIVNPVDLEVVQHGAGYAVALEGVVLKLSAGGQDLCHEAPHLLEQVIQEFDGRGAIELSGEAVVAPKFFGSYALLSIQHEWVESGRDDLAQEFAAGLVRDGCLFPVAGPEQVEQRARWGAIEPDRTELAGLPVVAEAEALRARLEPVSAELVARLSKEPMVEALRARYFALPPQHRAVVMMLHALHEGALLFPLALGEGRCTASEYAVGVMAGQAVLTTGFADVTGAAHSEAGNQLREDARTALGYLDDYERGTVGWRIRKIAAEGESERQEFKSALRYNAHAQKNDDDLKHGCMKSLAAFLNTDGGRLVIGVADGGVVVGIENDRFANLDKFQLHSWDVVKSTLGEACRSFLRAEALESEKGTVFVVECERSPEPVYCRTKGHGEQFFVRTGPGTQELPPSKLVQYVAQHWQRNGGPGFRS